MSRRLLPRYRIDRKARPELVAEIFKNEDYSLRLAIIRLGDCPPRLSVKRFHAGSPGPQFEIDAPDLPELQRVVAAYSTAVREWAAGSEGENQ